MVQNPSYDLIIVGAGMAGCILAARIAENGINPRNGEPLKIALLEWGPYLKGAPKPGYGHPVRRRAFTNIAPEFSEGDRYRTPWGKAKIVGGSALHYGAQAFLPLDVDYLHWQNETGVDWTQENFKDAVEEVRTMFNIHPAPRELLDVGQQLYERAATQLGHDLERMSHARKNCIYCGIGCRDGQMSKYDSKMNSFVAHLPIAEKYGVEIIPNTHVQKVMIEKKGSDFVTTGIWAEQGNRAVQFLADRVLLCACEGGTPWILYNSGYGPRDLLGKDLVVENPNVGRHVDGKLRVGGFSAYFPFPIKDGGRGMPGAFYFFLGGSAGGYDRLLCKEGISNLERPDRLALHEFAPEFGREHKKFMSTGGDHIAASVTLQYKRRQGLEGYIQKDGSHVYPTSATLDPQAARQLREGMSVMRDIFREMGGVQIGDIDPVLKRLQTVGDSSSEASQSPVTATHQSGSCRAGVDRKDSVVNERFESHDVKDLFICDLSVPPRVTYGNPGIAMVAPLACFAWRRLVKDHFSRSSLVA